MQWFRLFEDFVFHRLLVWYIGRRRPMPDLEAWGLLGLGRMLMSATIVLVLEPLVVRVAASLGGERERWVFENGSTLTVWFFVAMIVGSTALSIRDYRRFVRRERWRELVDETRFPPSWIERGWMRTAAALYTYGWFPSTMLLLSMRAQ